MLVVGLPDLDVSLAEDTLAVGDIPALVAGDIPAVAEEGTQVQVEAGQVVAGLDNLSVLRQPY